MFVRPTPTWMSPGWVSTMQCAAVSTHSLLMTEPPQKWPSVPSWPLLWSEAMKGNSPSATWEPPTMASAGDAARVPPASSGSAAVSRARTRTGSLSQGTGSGPTTVGGTGYPVLGPRLSRSRPSDTPSQPPAHLQRPQPRWARPPPHLEGTITMSHLLHRLGRSTAAHPWRTISAWVLVAAAVVALAGAVRRHAPGQLGHPRRPGPGRHRPAARAHARRRQRQRPGRRPRPATARPSAAGTLDPLTERLGRPGPRRLGLPAAA